MKVRTFLLMLLAVLAFNAKAQTTKVPDWKKFVRVNNENVNLRKLPNAQSPRLLVALLPEAACRI